MMLEKKTAMDIAYKMISGSEGLVRPSVQLQELKALVSDDTWKELMVEFDEDAWE